ncbi:YheC/YheD family protein [Bacillus sp. 31A1R]|uniref:YheC/YheD family protein n=1 Tax=Robertmurraya mangrovi TaxID=3098077 RepID=A0ABU5J0V7_9BACI|nr:YheC/YheD family protein [Bacillus sp. 31A1R]MDZ5472990.1 YheC/YheD family protein [Bacillus sp. 31A1R]
MVHKIGKLEQSVLFLQDDRTKNYFPETVEYRKEKLEDFIKEYPFIYVKHDSSGQGRGVFRISKSKQKGLYHIDGYTFFGVEVKALKSVNEIHKILNPFEKFGRLDPYIIQEGITSTTLAGEPFNIRVHVQKTEEGWIASGMCASYALPEHMEHGVINTTRGTKLISIEELLGDKLGLKGEKFNQMRKKLGDVCISAAMVTDEQYPCLEIGVDIGITPSGHPMIFEINTTPGIKSFYKLNQAMWNHIMDIRRARLKKQ